MSRLIDVAAVLDRMANALRGTEQGEACAFAVRLLRERESIADETQELAEALELALPFVMWSGSEGRHPDDYPQAVAIIKARRELGEQALARHRAKQEVQS